MGFLYTADVPLVSARHSRLLSILVVAMSWEPSSRGFREAIYSAIPNQWILPPDVRDGSLKDVSSIPATCGLLSDKQLEITEQTASTLVKRLASRELSSVDVTEAFCTRAAIAHQLVRKTRRLL